MKKISEMTLEELQDYAVQLKGENKTLTDSIAEKDKQIDEVNGYNRQLQARNNSLFMQLEQQNNAGDNEENQEQEQEKTESCEDFARRLINGGK